jgi:hypothetical protein
MVGVGNEVLSARFDIPFGQALSDPVQRDLPVGTMVINIGNIKPTLACMHRQMPDGEFGLRVCRPSMVQSPARADLLGSANTRSIP